MAAEEVSDAVVAPAEKRGKDDVVALSAWMVENGWVVLGFERHLVEKRTSQPSRLRPLAMEATQLGVFNLHVPEEVWELLCAVVNRNLVAGRSECTDTRRRDTNCNEMKGWYALQMAMENTWGNATRLMRDHFAVVKKEYGAVPGLGGDRFRFISAACNPTPDELQRISELLENAAKRQLEAVHVVAIDESVIGYNPRKATKEHAEEEGKPIPTVYMPRKPHPNGLECFLACTYVTNPANGKQEPYVCSIVPHLRSNDYTSIAVAEKIIREWPAALGKPHYIVDAAFGDEKLVLATASVGSELTASMSTTRLGTLWKALSCSLPTGCWRAAVRNADHLVASVHCGIDNDGRRSYQHVISTNWTCTMQDLQQQQVQASEQEGQAEAEAEAAAMQSTVNKIPQYTRETLNGQTLAELKAICKTHNIRSGSRKEDVINSILARVEVVHRKFSEVEKMHHTLTEHWFKGDGPLHITYKENFNWVDLVDRAWNAVEEHHLYQHWTAKYLRFLMRFAVYNAMVHSQQNHGQNWLQFRETLAKQIIASLKQ